MTKIDRRKLPKSKEHIEKFKASMIKRRQEMGPTPYFRSQESDAPHEINDVWGSPGYRILPKFDTSNKP